MFPSVVHARYTMLADVYKQHIEQDPDTGQIIRTWDTANPIQIRCMARGIMGQGIRVVGSTERWSGGEYENVEWVKLQCQENLSKRDRVGNIRTIDSQGRETRAWSDIIVIGPGEIEEVDTIFEILGATPILDPFGNLIEFDVLMTRAEQQTEVPVEPDDPGADYDEDWWN